jgi:hypothetical protein
MKSKYTYFIENRPDDFNHMGIMFSPSGGFWKHCPPIEKSAFKLDYFKNSKSWKEVKRIEFFKFIKLTNKKN